MVDEVKINTDAEISITIDDVSEEAIHVLLTGKPLWPDEVIDTEWPHVIDDDNG